MGGAFVGECDLRRALRERLAVEFHAGHAATYGAWVFDRDFVTRRAVSIDNLEARPLARDARVDQQRFAAENESLGSTAHLVG
jgi:hypothetical protein